MSSYPLAWGPQIRFSFSPRRALPPHWVGKRPRLDAFAVDGVRVARFCSTAAPIGGRCYPQRHLATCQRQVGRRPGWNPPPAPVGGVATVFTPPSGTWPWHPAPSHFNLLGMSWTRHPNPTPPSQLCIAGAWPAWRPTNGQRRGHPPPGLPGHADDLERTHCPTEWSRWTHPLVSLLSVPSRTPRLSSTTHPALSYCPCRAPRPLYLISS